MRALLAEFQELSPSADGYAEAVTALRVSRDAMAAPPIRSRVPRGAAGRSRRMTTGPVHIRDEDEQWAD
ncbi:hypothetical protein L5G28_09180 [Gordonia sp. HY285]|uniref:Uncharacterized protein n=1 Tax=Gordonia liuliyuniae TaxID=2911517 RepID=A0ABS9IWW7_9ACTN|nr:hypothetical protein [Gordonia liuliyuniae]MCF8590049.1 hypothetical protein [Gordonia liuliyuniae]MCF8610327.1 hypothetical protein [Gordonia liuliyuniae]